MKRFLLKLISRSGTNLRTASYIRVMTVTEVADDWQVTALLKLFHLTFSLQVDQREHRKQGSRKNQSNKFMFSKTNFFEYKGSQ